MTTKPTWYSLIHPNPTHCWVPTTPVWEKCLIRKKFCMVKRTSAVSVGTYMWHSVVSALSRDQVILYQGMQHWGKDYSGRGTRHWPRSLPYRYQHSPRGFVFHMEQIPDQTYHILHVYCFHPSITPVYFLFLSRAQPNMTGKPSKTIFYLQKSKLRLSGGTKKRVT